MSINTLKKVMFDKNTCANFTKDIFSFINYFTWSCPPYSLSYFRFLSQEFKTDRIRTFLKNGSRQDSFVLLLASVYLHGGWVFTAETEIKNAYFYSIFGVYVFDSRKYWKEKQSVWHDRDMTKILLSRKMMKNFSVL